MLIMSMLHIISMYHPRAIRLVIAFTVANARACLFPLFIFVALALSHLLPSGVPRYDALLVACLAMQAVMLATRLETLDELKVISLFHLLGLGLELFKVHVGSWSYPEEAFTKVAGVPPYAGFMYASVASYMVQAWRLLALRVHRWPRRSIVVPLGVVIYANFFTHHALADLRYPAIVATFLGAWQYPHQASGWHVVSPWKLTSWSLLVIVSMMAVVELKRIKGARPGERQDVLADVGSAPPQPLHAHASVGGHDAANLHVASAPRVVVDART